MQTVAPPRVVDDRHVLAAQHAAGRRPEGQPGGVHALADLARPELMVALCAPQVPSGAAPARPSTAPA